MSGYESKASATNDGSGITVTSSDTATPIVYQCVTAHGIAAVGNSDVSISYAGGMASLTQTTSGKNPTVFLPIPNPPAFQASTSTLQNILVNFEGSTNAKVETVTLYYDQRKIVSVYVDRPDTFHIDFDPKMSDPTNYAYKQPEGISVALALSFPDTTTEINLYSVTLNYKQV